MLMFFALLRNLLGLFELGLPTMIIAHITFQTPFIGIIVRSRLADMDPAMEEAAHDLGADTWQTFRHVTLPLMMPGVFAGAALAFTMSIDDFVVSFFTAGPGSTTLPILIYSSVKRGITPDINALSTVIAGVDSWDNCRYSAAEAWIEWSLEMTRALLLLLPLFLVGCGQPKERLNVFIWSDYSIPKSSPRSRNSSIASHHRFVREPGRDDGQTFCGRSFSLRHRRSSNNTLPPLIKLGLLSPLRHENIPNLKNVDPQFANPLSIPGVNMAFRINGAPRAFSSASRRTRLWRKPGVDF
jgi:hypothetical protein